MAVVEVSAGVTTFEVESGPASGGGQEAAAALKIGVERDMINRRDREFNTVYSTDDGRLCPSCAQPVAQCRCRQAKRVPTGDGTVRVGRETKGRKGKGVTLVTGVLLEDRELQQLAKQLKQKCGAGGSVKNGVIEVQGDHRDTIVEELKKQGYTVKRSGG